MNSTARHIPAGNSAAFRRLNVKGPLNPLVRRIFDEMNEQRVSTNVLAASAGVSVSCLNDWRTRHSPRIDNVEACLNALGLELVVQRKEPKK